MMAGHRVAVGAIFTECNQLGGVPIDLRRFEQYELCRGDEIAGIGSGVVGGMLRELRRRDVMLAPLVYASTCPGGPLTSACYRRLKSELLDRLATQSPVDGILLPLHGAAVVEDVGDLEGDLLEAVRRVVGPAVPVVATLDLHAQVTAEMVRSADALVAWKTYPHRDTTSTGQRGARLLLDLLDGRCRPTMAMAKVPLITDGVNGCTDDDGAFARIMRMAKSYESHGGVLSTSLFMGYPYQDLPRMGSGGLVITDNDPDQAVLLARRLADEIWARRLELDPEVIDPVKAIEAGRKVEGGPVLLVETADCCGGGASGDSIATLAALLVAANDASALVPVVDPDAAAACHRVGAGQRLSVDLGHRIDPRWGTPIQVTGSVARLGDGRFRYVGGIWDDMEADMGPSAVLRVGAIDVLVMTHATYDWADEQFRAMGLDPSAVKFVVVKNPMNFRNAYGRIAKATFILETPGPTPATVRHVPYRNLRRPFFPRDIDIPDLTPTILQ